MAYGAAMIDTLVELGKRGVVARGMRVLEFGAQEINADVPADTLHRFHAFFGGGMNAALDDLPGKAIGPLFEASGIGYDCIDLFDGFKTTILDLNRDELPAAMVGAFDLVTNIGTTEHVANQLQCFKILHDAVKVGGHVLCQVPMTGYINHGLIKYEPKFFVSLLRGNGYGLVLVAFTPPHRMGVDAYPEYARVINISTWSGLIVESGLITILYRKLEDKPFAPPLDADQRNIGDRWEADFEPYFIRD